MGDDKVMFKMIVDQKYWNNSYEKYKLQRLPRSDPTLKLIKKYIPTVKNDAQAFEIGCYPGRFLVEIGQKGYTLNGCDLAPQISTRLSKWLLNNNCKVNKLYNKSYIHFVGEKYDLVASFGFIEHFENYEEVFLQQCGMVRNGGILLIQFPNFRGLIQWVLHRCFDKDNLFNHVIQAMDLKRYKKILPSTFKLIYCSYYGNFDFWIDDYMQRNGKIKKRLIKLFQKTSKLWKILPDSSLYSPYGMLIARKKKKW